MSAMLLFLVTQNLILMLEGINMMDRHEVSQKKAMFATLKGEGNSKHCLIFGRHPVA